MVLLAVIAEDYIPSSPDAPPRGFCFGVFLFLVFSETNIWADQETKGDGKYLHHGNFRRNNEVNTLEKLLFAIGEAGRVSAWDRSWSLVCLLRIIVNCERLLCEGHGDG